MKAQMQRVNLNSDQVVDAQPDRAESQAAAEGPIVVRVKQSIIDDDITAGVEEFLASHRLSGDLKKTEVPVRIHSYMGSLPDHIGNDGDFYVDEMTNIIYGPKVNGVWPEDGEIAAGLCKRTWIALTRTRLSKQSDENKSVISRLIALLRLLSPLRLLKA